MPCLSLGRGMYCFWRSINLYPFYPFYKLISILITILNTGMLGQKMSFKFYIKWLFEPRHDKTNKMSVRPAKTQISLGIRPVWSESSLFAWRKLGPLPIHWAQSEDSDQSGRMPRLIWVFAGRTVILLVLSWVGSFLQKIFLFTVAFGNRI